MSEEKLSHLIARTILRVKYGLATDGEKRTLEQWLEGGEERRRIYDRILSGESWKEYAALREDFDRATDYGQLQSDILQSIRLRNRRRSLRRAIVWGSSVAAVLLVGVLVVARFAREAKPVVPQPLAQTVPAQPQMNDKVVLVPEAGLQLPDDLRLEPGEGDCWVLTWRNATDYPAQQDADRVMVALMRGGKYFDVRILEEAGIASRGEGRAVFRIPEGWEEYRHLYCFLASEDRSHASASRYLGMLGQSGTR